MRFRVRYSGMFVLAAVMVVLLGALAVLQYRWVGQLSADERDRIREHLKDSAEEFAEDFNRELTRAFFWLQVGPEVRHDQPAEPDALRYERWFAGAPRPDLIATIYQVDVDEGGALLLRQFFRQEPRLEPAEWPALLTPVRDALRERHAGPVDPVAPRFTRVPFVWPDLPAMVVPRARLFANAPDKPLGPAPVLSGYVIAVLNDSYIRQQLVPMLVERHFAKGPDGALHVAVKGEKGVVYATPGALPKVLEHADVAEGLWDIRLFEFNRFVVERRESADGPDGRRGDGGERGDKAQGDGRGQEARGGGDGSGGRRHDDRDAHDGGMRDAARAAIAAAASPRILMPPPPGTSTTNILMIRGDDRGRGWRNAAGGLPVWHVHVLHGAGSLDAAVARARGRNLLVSFGVLLLLGASMGLVLISSARARRLAEQQMEFVAGVSHELRTPLAVIRSAGENLADGIVDDDKQVRRYGQLIAGEGRRLTQMVEQIMTFAGLQAGRPGFDVRPIEVGPVVDEALSAVAPVAREQDAGIDTDVAPGLPRILADPGAVGRALQNLLGNALKYGGEPPRIRVTARLSPVHGRREVELIVADHGPGIAPRDLPHIFEPFYRGADVVARQIHGSGLGLSLVQRIMQELGGRVTVTSTAGEGSSFTLHLPLAPEVEAVPHGSPVHAE